MKEEAGVEGGTAFWCDSYYYTCCSDSLPCTCPSELDRDKRYRNAVSFIWQWAILDCEQPALWCKRRSWLPTVSYSTV